MADTIYTVYVGLTREGLDRKINAIKTWREIASCGLKEAKDFVEDVASFDGAAHIEVVITPEALIRFLRILQFQPMKQQFVLSEVKEGTKPRWDFT
jgi:hypothetical protein